MGKRIITAVVNDDDSLIIADNAGFTGEHNADELHITLNDELSGNDYDFLALIFNTCIPGGCFSSNTIKTENDSPVSRHGNVIVCPLGEQLTSSGVLCVQVAAYRSEGAQCIQVRKSGIATVNFRPSVMGSAGFLTASAGFENEVRSAVEAFRTYGKVWQNSEYYFHTHTNSDVLDKLYEIGDELSFNGRVVSSTYTLPTASKSEKGGVKPGFGLEMDGENLGMNTDILRISAAYTACTLSGRPELGEPVLGSPYDLSYKDENDIGITENLLGMDDMNPFVCYVPTKDGPLVWYDYDYIRHVTYTSIGIIYVFKLDTDSMGISVQSCTASLVAGGEI